MVERVDADPKIFVISGPSGAGKGTLAAGLLKRVPSLCPTVSATSRKPRPGEIEGVSYFFLSEQEFKEKIKRGEFVEWAVVHGNLYGTLKSEIERILESGKHVLLELDIQGARVIKQKIPESVLIFIEPPTLDDLKQRLKRRDTESEEDIARRLQDAIREMKVAEKYDYVVINDKIDKAIEELVSIVENEMRRR
jgi:guanylate kinase